MSHQSNLRIIIIYDNPAIHQDFIKVLTTQTTGMEKLPAKTEQFREFKQFLFGTANKEEKTSSNAANFLPKFQIDTANQGQEGVECIAKALNEGNPYGLGICRYSYATGLGRD